MEVVDEDIIRSEEQDELQQEHESDEELSDEWVEGQDPNMARQLDELGYCKTSHEVEREIRERRHNPADISAVATMRSIETAMDGLQTKKKLQEIDVQNMEYELEKLAERTILYHDAEPLRSVSCDRICQIENRLRYDPSLQLTEDDLDFTVPERADVFVRQKLADAYVKVKAANWNLEDRVIKDLDQRIRWKRYVTRKESLWVK
eukprot:GEMP01060977.1.p1 GENE.GEMP01060977.1~~GEMP01060977.1.p1  ORF type:complete len:205 (+),score=43.33 GEMP01060977.1:136-750(+)